MVKKQLGKKVSELGKNFSDATISLHEAIARHAGLTGVDHKYLNILLSETEMTAGELSSRTGLTTGAITGVIDRLERRGLITRKFAANDRRKVLLVANRKAVQDVLGPASEILQRKVLGLVKKFSEAEQDVIGRYLEEAIKVMAEVKAKL